MTSCPLCSSSSIRTYKNYYECGICALVFADHANFLSAQEEKKRYDQHNNDPKDERYVNFLKRLLDPLTVFLENGMKGLDFGCGPGPAVSVVMKEKGFDVSNYDPFYFADTALLEQKYDFLTCTETIEHFYAPAKEFALFDRLIKKGGYIGILDQFLTENIDFDSWWYKKDPTHVSFYRPSTMGWLAKKYDWETVRQTEQTVIFRKK